MKKTYITPALLAVKIESTQLMAMSGDGDEQWDQMNSKGFEGHAGGLLWEDDNNEAE